MTWDDLKFWSSGEWQVVEDSLNDLKDRNVMVSPARKDLFRVMKLVPIHKVRVMIMGQDPYPDPSLATGVAFSIPKESQALPPTLFNMFKEYENDLHYPWPESGNLEKWCKQGVFLWNAYPSCQAWKSLSHKWDEWGYLTREIIQVLCEQPRVFVFLGVVAREFAKSVTEPSTVVALSHPSPRGSLRSKQPFFGSRMYSTVNDKLTELGLEPIDWRL